MASNKIFLENPQDFKADLNLDLEKAWIVEQEEGWFTAMIKPNTDWFNPHHCKSLQAAKKSIREHCISKSGKRMKWGKHESD